MGKELLLNQTLNECRAALLDSGEILDYLMERHRLIDNHPSVGNIYRGRVLRVLPGMQSAFVDIGYEKAAFLYVDDAYIPTLQEQREMAELSKKNLEEEGSQQIGEIIPDELNTGESVVHEVWREAAIETFLRKVKK